MSPPYFLGQGLWLTLETTKSVRLASLASPFGLPVSHPLPTVGSMEGICLQSQSQHTGEAMAQGPGQFSLRMPLGTSLAAIPNSPWYLKT